MKARARRTAGDRAALEQRSRRERRRRPEIAIASGLVLLALAVYWPVLSSNFITMDDGLYVTENRHVRAGLTTEGVVWAFSNGEAGMWHPVTWLSHMLDCG